MEKLLNIVNEELRLFFFFLACNRKMIGAEEKPHLLNL